MTRVFVSLIVGAVLSWLLYIAAYEGPSGLTTIVVIFTFPIRLVASLVTKHRDTGEVVYWTLLTCLNTLIVYSGCFVVAAVKRHKK